MNKQFDENNARNNLKQTNLFSSRRFVFTFALQELNEAEMDNLEPTEDSSSSEIIAGPKINKEAENPRKKEIHPVNETTEIGALQDIPKLRMFLLEKLTARQLIKLIIAYDEIPEQHNDHVTTVHTANNNIRTHPMRVVHNSKRKVPFSCLVIGNLAIQSPHLAHPDVNYVEVCKTTSCLIYKMNFMLGDNWCGCTISVKLSQIQSILHDKTDIVLSLSQPSAIQDSYVNGVLSFLGAANTEVEQSCTHKIRLRTVSDWCKLKLFLISADPSVSYKIKNKSAPQIISTQNTNS